jgi:hypothetical protein
MPSAAAQPLAAIPTVDSELLTLVNRLCDQHASAADCQRLEALLSDPAHPDAIAVYCAMMEVHVSLRWRWHAGSRGQWLPAGSVASPVARQPRRVAAAASEPQPRGVLPTAATRPAGGTAQASPQGSAFERLRSWFQGLGKTATLAIVFQAAIVLLALALAVLGQAWQGAPSSIAKDGPARIVGADEALWSMATGELVVGDTLAAGRQLRLTKGLVEIDYGPAVTVVLEGPATFTLPSGKSLALDRGRAAVTVHEAGKDGASGQSVFVVQTPSATISDRGTRFGVAVDPQGQTDVHVFEGLVDCGGRGLSNALLGDWFTSFFGSWFSSGPQRLSAGEAAAIDWHGSVSRLPQAVPRQFARALPPRDALAWNAAQATRIYRDPLVAAGPLTGSQPAAHGGVGDARWSAPATGWTLTASGLEARGPGSASLPFVPVAGRVYRLAVELTVTAGGSDWAAIGFSGPPKPANQVLTCGWMLQRQSTELDPNGLFVGADEASLQFSSGDRKTGRRTFVVLLDTRPARWTVTFVADGTRLETEQLPPAARIESVGLSCFGSAQAIFSSFSLSFLASKEN